MLLARKRALPSWWSLRHCRGCLDAHRRAVTRWSRRASIMPARCWERH